MEKDTTNLSKMRREKLLAAIKEIKEGMTDTDKITALNEIENELLEMKYGLKWEKHEEQVDRDLLTKIPVFKEDKEREIVKTEGDFNFLLEGDNLHSLMLLEKTHRNSIPVIYIDVPYNTGKNDFKYGDKMIETEDDYKHSKWLSFMERRLRLIYELLSEDGVLFVSIDDNEQANLKLLMDSIFGENNFIVNMAIENNPKGRKNSLFISKSYEYVLVYTKQRNYYSDKYIKFNLTMSSQKDKRKILRDSIGEFKQGKRQIIGTNSNIEATNNPGRCVVGYYNENNGNFKMLNEFDEELNTFSFSDEGNVLVTQGYKRYLPVNKDSKKPNICTYSYDKMMDLYKNNNLIFLKDSIYEKERNFKQRMRSLLTRDNSGVDILTETAGVKLREMGLDGDFNNPKPVDLIKELIRLHPKTKNQIILDAFAGSGTTGHAVLELNKEDGGNRKFILCTNNEVGEAKEKEFKKLHGDKEDHPDKWAAWEDEHGIARSVTYKRLEKVINGYTTPKGKEVEGIPANLKCYKTEYILREMEDDDYDAHDEINKYIIELIQLEFAIDIHNPKIGLVLSDEYMESENFNVKEIDDKKLDEIKCVYVAEGIMLSGILQEKIDRGDIELKWVPQYYKF